MERKQRYGQDEREWNLDCEDRQLVTLRQATLIGGWESGKRPMTSAEVVGSQHS